MSLFNSNYTQSLGIPFTQYVTSSAGHSLISSSTFFNDTSDNIPRYKDASGTVLTSDSIFTNFANTDLTVNATRTHELNSNDLTIQDTSTGTSLFLDPNTPEVSLYLGQHAVTVQNNGILLNAAVGLTSNIVLLTTASIEFNNANADADFIVDSNSGPSLFVEGSTGYVGINTTTPNAPFEVQGQAIVSKAFSTTQGNSGTLSGSYNDFTITTSFYTLRANADVQFSGFYSGSSGHRIVIYARDLGTTLTASFLHNNSASTLGNRLINGNTGQTINLQEGDTIEYIYDDLGNNWVYIGGSV